MQDECLYPQPTAALAKPGWRSLFSYLGPGAIIASVTIGSGELVWASRSGAIFGYTMLWCFLYAGVFKAIQVYTAGRHITLTGEHPMETWKRLPGPPLWFPLLIAVPAVMLMPIAFSGIPEILGGFVHRLLGVPLEGLRVGPFEYREFWVNVWATVVLIACLGLALGSSYQLLERVSTVVLGVIVVCVAASVMVFGPDLIAVFRGMFVPRVADYPQWLVTSPRYAGEFEGRSPWLEISLYLTAVGGGAYDYIGYVGMMRQKRWGLAGRRVAARHELDAAVSDRNAGAAETVRRAMSWTRAPLLDTTISFFFVILVTLLFGILATLVLHTQHAVPANNDLLNEQETFLTHFHPSLSWLYRTGVFLAFIGTLYGAFEVYRQTFAESAAAVLPKLAQPHRLPAIRAGVVAYCFFGGLVMIWLPAGVAGNIVDRMTFGTIVSGAGACGLWCFAMVWADYVRLPPSLRMRPLLRLLAVIAGLGMTFLGVQTTIAYFGG
jgi:Mn2+/Fe2+ NRAMP family transporter